MNREIKEKRDQQCEMEEDFIEEVKLQAELEKS